MSHVINERIRLRIRDLLTERRHFAADITSVHYRIKNALVADLILPLRICKIPGVLELCFHGFRSSIFAVT